MGKLEKRLGKNIKKEKLRKERLDGIKGRATKVGFFGNGVRVKWSYNNITNKQRREKIRDKYKKVKKD